MAALKELENPGLNSKESIVSYFLRPLRSAVGKTIRFASATAAAAVLYIGAPSIDTRVSVNGVSIESPLVEVVKAQTQFQCNPKDDSLFERNAIGDLDLQHRDIPAGFCTTNEVAFTVDQNGNPIIVIQYFQGGVKYWIRFSGETGFTNGASTWFSDQAGYHPAVPGDRIPQVPLVPGQQPFLNVIPPPQLVQQLPPSFIQFPQPGQAGINNTGIINNFAPGRGRHRGNGDWENPPNSWPGWPGWMTR